jgi:hypothetical protein
MKSCRCTPALCASTHALHCVHLCTLRIHTCHALRAFVHLAHPHMPCTACICAPCASTHALHCMHLCTVRCPRSCVTAGLRSLPRDPASAPVSVSFHHSQLLAHGPSHDSQPLAHAPSHDSQPHSSSRMDRLLWHTTALICHADGLQGICEVRKWELLWSEWPWVLRLKEMVFKTCNDDTRYLGWAYKQPSDAGPPSEPSADSADVNSDAAVPETETQHSSMPSSADEHTEL